MKLNKLQREALRGMFDGRCAYCGSTLGERWHADHVERVMKWAETNGRRRLVCTGEVHPPARDTVENLMPACAPCNIDKHAMTLEDWRGKLQRSAEVLARNQPTYRHAVRFGLVQETGAAVVFYFESIAKAEAGAAIPSGEATS